MIFGKGVTSGLAYNAKNDTFGISNTEGGVYFTDANFKETAQAIIDKPNGRNIKKAVASTFVGDMLVTIGFNKTTFAVKPVGKGTLIMSGDILERAPAGSSLRGNLTAQRF